MTPSTFRFLRRKLNSGGFAPRSRLARLFLLFLTLEAVIFAVQRLLARTAHPAAAENLDFWVWLLAITNAVLLGMLALRWVRRVLMWRLRYRLIVTYVFIGVIPVALVSCMAMLAAYLFAGQLAIYVATSDLHAEMQRLQAANEVVAAQVMSEYQKGGAPRGKRIERSEPEPYAGSNLQAHFGATPVTISATVTSRGEDAKSQTLPGVEIQPKWLEHSFTAIAIDDGKLFLRAATVEPAGEKNINVISSVPLDAKLLAQIWPSQNEVTLDTGAIINVRRFKDADDVDRSLEQKSPGVWPRIQGGALNDTNNPLDRPLSFASTMPVMDWRSGESRDVFFAVKTRPSVLYDRLFSVSALSALVVIAILNGTAVLFGLIVMAALVVGVRITRTVTKSVAELYQATERVNRGDLRHRIKVTSRDQLAALESSFNSMTESLEQLIVEQKEKQRLQGELAIAQEVQSQLFPHDDVQLRSLELHGVCRPARTVSGDYYDFLPLADERMAVAVGDISGKGISAALLMATIHSAVRVYEMGGMPERAPRAAIGKAARAAGYPGAVAALDIPVASAGLNSPSQVMWLLNRHLFNSTPSEKYATLFLGVYDGCSRSITYCNAGHLPPLVISRDGSIRKLETGGMVIGLFHDTEYEENTVTLNEGDLFVAYSDGITEPENEFGEFGEERLLEILQENLGLPLSRLSELVTTAVQDWTGASEQPDDVTLVLARAL